MAEAATDRVIVVTVDSHVAPPMELMRPYCSEQYLEEYDAWMAAYSPGLLDLDPAVFFSDGYLEGLLNSQLRPLMHYDPDERLADMDADGVAAEVVYHGALNGHSIPFYTVAGIAVNLPSSSREHELIVEGFRMYHRWLADYCGSAPGRRCGLIHLPFWDLEASVAIIEEADGFEGLKGINMPALRPGLLGYHNPHWEPLWRACSERDLSLNLHGGVAAVDLDQLVGTNAGSLTGFEMLYWCRRALFFMIIGGVFDRYPDLKFVMTEQPTGWVKPILGELDDAAGGPIFRRPDIKKRPSEYFKSNCYIGASFMSQGDVAYAQQYGLQDQFLWGSDYPHVEGTFPHSKLSLRHALEGVESEEFIRGVCGLNAVPLYGFDQGRLQAVADRIGPTLSELQTPVDPADLPSGTPSLGFRGDTQSWAMDDFVVAR